MVLSPLCGQDVIDLSGMWEFQMDRADEGRNGAEVRHPLDDRILLPGSMPQRLKGDRPGVHTRWTASLYDSSFFYNPHLARYRTDELLKLPFFLTPDRHYVGGAWYKTTVELPAAWKGRRVVLSLERPHITTTLWVNGRRVGRQNSLSTPHEYDLTPYVRKGRNSMTLYVDNRIDEVCVGADSHSVTDQTQGNWNGVVGRLELRSMPTLYMEDIQVHPDIDRKLASVHVRLRRNGGRKGESARLTLSAYSFNSETSHHVPAVTTPLVFTADTLSLCVTLPMGDDVQLWDEFHPALYCLTATLASERGTHVDTRTFGMRTFETRGRLFCVNHRPVLLRGTVENCDFPLTGYPPMDDEAWERVFRICRSYGLNHMRFHSYCPPEAAFRAADKVGFYLQPEGPSWPNHGVKLGNGMPIDRYLMEETQRIDRYYGSHPSFCMLSCGNEPAGNWVPWVSAFVDYWRQTDERHVYTGASVGGGWAWQPRNMYHVKAGVRGLDEWRRRAPESVSDFRTKIDTVSVPFVSHETGQWCAFPNFDEITKYTGVNKARNFELFRDLLRENGMEERARKFLSASGKLQVLCYKYEMEKTLRTPGYAGFQLLSLNDYSGQGTALVGPLDVFFEEKGYVDAEAFREFCSPTVLLARIPKFTYWHDEPFTALLEVTHFGRSELTDVQVGYRICDPYGKLYTAGRLPVERVPLGHAQPLGELPPFRAADAAGTPRRYTLELELAGLEKDATGVHRVRSRNHWNFWVYPRTVADYPEKDVYVCDSLDEKALATLREGGKVLVCAAGRVAYGKDVVQHFLPVFWNTSWFKMRPPHTIGLYIENKHPLFTYFPTDEHSDLQWWHLVNRQSVMLLSEFPRDFQPIVQSIDTWFLSRKIGMLFEVCTGGGRLMMTTFPLAGDTASAHPYADRPVVAQMRAAILRYMQSDAFRPAYTVDLACVQRLFTEQAPPVDLYTRDSPDELKPKLK